MEEKYKIVSDLVFSSTYQNTLIDIYHFLKEDVKHLSKEAKEKLKKVFPEDKNL